MVLLGFYIDRFNFVTPKNTKQYLKLVFKNLCMAKLNSKGDKLLQRGVQ